MTIIKLKITSWSGCINGEHYTGVLKFSINGQLIHIEVEQKVSQKMALYLNKKSSARGYALYRPGDLTDKFDTERQLIKKAIEIVKKNYPESLLFLGDYGCCSVEKLIYWPAHFNKEAEKINSLFDQMEKIGWYEGNYDKAREIDDEFDRILKEIKYEK